MIPDVPKRGFDVSEFKQRCHKAQLAMAAQDIAGILMMSEPEVRYFTGFQTLFWQSPTRPWFVFLPAAGKPVALIPEIGAALMRQTWVDDIRTWNAPAPDDDGLSLLIELLLPLASSKARLGVMKGHETHLRMPLADWERLMASLPGLDVVDVTALLQSQRMVKSAAELEKLAYVCGIGSATFEQVPCFATEGKPLEDVFRQFRRSALELGVDDAPYLVGGAGQGGYVDVISPPTRKALQKGDVLMLDTGCIWDGYYCDFDRNWAIGQASTSAQQAYDVLWHATEAGIEAARAGTSCKELFQIMSAVIAQLDSSAGSVGRLGHGLGMQLTEQPSHAAFDDTLLTENMVLTLEPSLSYGDGLMMVHEENIVVGTTGSTLLSNRAAPELPVI